MRDVQQFLKEFQRDMQWDITDESYEKSYASMLHNYMLLTTEVGEVAEEFRAIFNKTQILIDEGMPKEEAFRYAKSLHQENIGKELADCIAYIVKFANYLSIDLEDSFYAKMAEIKTRVNKDS